MIVITEKLIEETEYFYYYDVYHNGNFMNKSMKLKTPSWIWYSSKEKFKMLGLHIEDSKIESLMELYGESLDIYYYIYVANCEYIDETVKWLLGIIASSYKKDISLNQFFPAYMLKFLVKYIAEDKIPKHFSKEIFEILITKKPSYYEIVEFLDKLIMEPRFKIVDTSELDDIIKIILDQYPEKVIEAKTNPKLIKWFMGQILKNNKGLSPQTLEDKLVVYIGDKV